MAASVRASTLIATSPSAQIAFPDGLVPATVAMERAVATCV